jgi:hypothetical protein
MNEPLRMHVVNSFTYLNQDLPDKLKVNCRQWFLYRYILLQIAHISVQVPSVSIFEAEYKPTVPDLVCVHKVHIVHFDYIGMVSQRLQHSDLPEYVMSEALGPASLALTAL